MREHQSAKKLVILDLDETLIHSTIFPPHNTWNLELFDYKVFIRPGLDAFLKGLADHFQIAVWSSAADHYVEEVVKNIFPTDYPLKFIWGRSNCTLQSNQPIFGNTDPMDHMNYVKVLQKVSQMGYGEMQHLIMVDDSPSKSIHNPENAITPDAYLGGIQDSELEYLLKYLLKIKDVPDIRDIDKTDWRSVI